VSGIVIRDNLPDFKRQLERVSQELQVRSVRRSASATARLMRDAVKRAAGLPKSPKSTRPRTGTLIAAVYALRNRRTSTRGAERWIVGVRQGSKTITNRRTGISRKLPDAFYARFLEFGWIPRGRGNRIRGGTRRKSIERARLADKKVGYPFFGNAFRGVQSRALDTFIRAMTREVQQLDKIK
jgi:HK97 gp10 family phage protein